MGITSSVMKGLKHLKKGAMGFVDGLEEAVKDGTKAYKDGKGATSSFKTSAQSAKNKMGGAYNNSKEQFRNSGFYQDHKDNTSMKTVRGMKRAGKYTINKTLKFEDDADAFFGKKIKPTKVLMAGAFAATLVDPAKTVVREKQRQNYGEIEGGYAPGTINATSSPTFQSPLAYAQSEQGLKEISNNMGNSISRGISGVDAEVVFALHNLRNSGGGM